jgi:hypothetical protein
VTVVIPIVEAAAAIRLSYVTTRARQPREGTQLVNGDECAEKRESTALERRLATH